MELTPNHLVALGLTKDRASLYVGPLNLVTPIFDINTKARLAAFLAQALHETGLFSRMVENLNYSDPVRVAKLFRTGFDTNRDGKISPDEIAVASRYLHKPEALANRAYANRMGNGDEKSGMGWKYRGRGIFQLTGLANYAKAADELGQPYLDKPDLVALPPDACLTAAHFWSCNALNAYIDRGDFDGCTKRINSGMAGAEDRRSKFTLALQVLA